MQQQQNQRRIEIMNKYANLSPEHSVAELQALVPKFSSLSTQEKRKVFQSLQMTLVG